MESSNSKNILNPFKEIQPDYQNIFTMKYIEYIEAFEILLKG